MAAEEEGAEVTGRQGRPRPGGSLAPLVAAAALLFPLLAALRHLDDNSLTSWAWVLQGRDAVGIWVLHLAVVAAAAILARHPLPRPWRHPTLALGAFLAAAALRSEPEAIVDASRYFVQAKHLELYGIGAFLRAWGGGIPAWTDLPLVPFLSGLAFGAFGEHRAVIQLGTAALFALTVYATARIGRLLFDEPTGLAGGLLLLAVPGLLVQVPLLMTDVPAMCLVTLAFWGLLAAVEEGGAVRIAAAAAAIGAALLTKYSTWVLLAAAAGVILLVAAVQRRWRACGRGLAAAGAGGAVLAVFLVAKRQLVGGQLELLAGFQWEGLRRWGESYTSTFLFQAHPLVAVLSAVGLWRGARRRDVRVLLVACIPAILFLMQVRRTRYLLPALPLIGLLAARGLEVLGGEHRRRFVLLAAVGFSLVTVFALYLPFLAWTNTANLLAAGRFLDARAVRIAEVTALPTPGMPVNPELAIPLLDYHTAARLVRRGAQTPPPPEEVLRTSSFRFTWESRLPAWYAGAPGATEPVAQVLITGDPGAPLPPAFPPRPPDAVFARDAVFRLRTHVSIWLPAGRR